MKRSLHWRSLAAQFSSPAGRNAQFPQGDNDHGDGGGDHDHNHDGHDDAGESSRANDSSE